MPVRERNIGRKAIYIGDVPEELHLEVAIKALRMGTTMAAVGTALLEYWLTGALDGVIHPGPDKRTSGVGDE